MLRDKLDEAVEAKTPIIMIVAVIGSTEESSVDDLTEILKIRDEFALEKVCEQN